MEPIQYVHDPSEWPYPSADPNGQRHIRKKLEAAAGSKRQDPLTYSDLVGDVEFTLPDGRKHSIIVHDWTGFDRMLIGQHLGFLASESFTDHGFMLSAFAVDSSNRRPSNGFFDLGVAFGAFPKDDPKRRDSFWTTQMALAHEFYSTLAEMPSLQEFTDFQRSIFEGAEDKVPATIRKRCSYLLKQAQDHYRSPDGILRCAACEWCKPRAINKEVIEFHHLDQLSQAPAEGRRLPLPEAISRLQPLCPNCHRIAHCKGKGQHYTLDDLKKILKSAG